MDSNPTKIAIVGCGAVTERLHAPALRFLERAGEAEVVALQDPAAHQRHVLNVLFPRARSFATFDDICTAGAELALIASPPAFHCEQSIRCLQAGLSVLCEKPIAVSTVEARAMVDAARASRQQLAVGHTRRFFAASQFIKKAIDERRLGSVRSFRISEGGSFGWPAKSTFFFERGKGGGGVFIDVGTHVLDLLLWWFGHPRDWRYEDDRMGGVDASCRLEMDYGSFRGAVHLTRDYEIPNQHYIEFENGYIRAWPYEPERIEVGYSHWDTVLRGTLLTTSVGYASGFGAGRAVASFPLTFLDQWRNVIAARRGSEVLRVPGEEAVSCLELVESCYARRTFMEPPWLTEREQVRARQLGRTAP